MFFMMDKQVQFGSLAFPHSLVLMGSSLLFVGEEIVTCIRNLQGKKKLEVSIGGEVMMSLGILLSTE